MTTAFVLVTGKSYFLRAKRTILDLRTRGNWKGDIVLITIDFDVNLTFKEFYNLHVVSFPRIELTNLLNQIGKDGFPDTIDHREIHKVQQWEKFHVFDPYFLQWSRIVFLDAGLRVLDDVSHLLSLDYKNKILAPKDGKLYDHSPFQCQLSYSRPEVIEDVKKMFGEFILQENYMLNCMWIYDTSILQICSKNDLIDAMNTYPCCKTNEMGIMNLLFHFKHRLWERLPIKTSHGKYLFDWCELNQTDQPTTWRNYCFLKYPVTISFDDT